MTSGSATTDVRATGYNTSAPVLSLTVVAAAFSTSGLKLERDQLQQAAVFLEYLLTPSPSGPPCEPLVPGFQPGCTLMPWFFANGAMSPVRIGLSLSMIV